jgi:hypothetical protein
MLLAEESSKFSFICDCGLTKQIVDSIPLCHIMYIVYLLISYRFTATSPLFVEKKIGILQCSGIYICDV